MGIKLTIKNQDIVSLVFGCLYVLVLGNRIRRIQVNHLLVLVSLIGLYCLTVILIREELAVRVLHKCKLECPLAEFFLRQHSILYEKLEIVPFLLIFLAVIFKDIFQPVSDLLGYIRGNLLDIGI